MIFISGYIGDFTNGYVGDVMSLRAFVTMCDGGYPQGYWMKTDRMIQEIYDCCFEYDLVFNPLIEEMTKEELWEIFFEYDSWHHMGKRYRKTDFYSLNPNRVKKFCWKQTEKNPKRFKEKAFSRYMNAKKAMNK